MSALLEKAAGQYRQSAAITLQPPMWIVQAHADNAALLAEDLIAAGAHFGLWPERCLMIVFAPSPLEQPLRDACERYGRVRAWESTLDIDGTWEEYQP